jgi:predicted ATP-binding protein involved in virulence
MRIDELFIRQFRGFDYKEVALPGQFTLIVGENGSGKSTILNAAAVALGIFGATRLSRKWRKIEGHEIRETLSQQGERTLVSRAKETSIYARGQIGSAERVYWQRSCKGRSGPTPTLNFKADTALKALKELMVDAEANKQPLPLLVHYGAGRNWRPSTEKIVPALPETKERREDGYRDCLDEEVRTADLLQWFVREAAARDSRGRFRQSYEVVVEALRACIPGVENVDYDLRIQQPVVTIGGHAARFTNLSDGQRAMAAMVSDIAIRAITLNSYLIPERKRGRKAAPLRVLRETPGVVLIDELDVHLHPKWQRTVVESLRNTFPRLQFICTTHSPFIVQTARADEVINLDGQSIPNPAKLGIENIAEGIMGVEDLKVSPRYQEMKEAAKEYLLTLDEAARSPRERLTAYEKRLSEGIGPFADNPAFQAFLELKRAAKLGVREGQNGH